MKENDKKILLELIEDGRMNISDIAENTGLTRQTVSNRIDHMLEEGIIENFEVKLSKDKLGLKMKAYVMVEAEPSGDDAKLYESLIEQELITELHVVYGKYDLIVEIVTETERDLDRVLGKLRTFDEVKNTETFIVNKTLKEDHIKPYFKVLED